MGGVSAKNLLLILCLLSTVVAAPVAATAATWVATYIANPAEVPRVTGPHASIQGLAIGLGGAVFPQHGHAGTIDIVVDDDRAGAIDAWVCQNLDGDAFCDAIDHDATACIEDGTLNDWPVVASRSIVVFVSSPGNTIEGCDGNRQGQATTGTIALSYS